MTRRHLVVFIAAVALAACFAPQQEAVEPGRFEILGPGLFRYTESSSVLHPLYSEQGEHSRLVRLRERVEQAGLCPEGYRIVRRDPPMAYGGFNKRVYERVVTPVTYTGECLADDTAAGV